MSTTTFAIAVIAAFTLGLTLAAAIITIVGHESEETPRTRRLALGRAAARARADTPAPLLPKMVVDERMPPGVAAVVGPKRVDVFRVSDGEHVATAEIEARHAETVQRIQERVDELETEQELAARVAIGGGLSFASMRDRVEQELARKEFEVGPDPLSGDAA